MESCTNHAVWCTTIVRVRICECVFLKCVKNTFFLVHWSVFESVVFQWQLCHFHLIDLHTAFWNTCASVRKCVCVWQSKYLHVGSSKWHSRWDLKGATQQGFVNWLQFAVCHHQGLAIVSAPSFWILTAAQKVQERSTLGLKIFRTHIGFVDGSRHIIEIW